MLHSWLISVLLFLSFHNHAARVIFCFGHAMVRPSKDVTKIRLKVAFLLPLHMLKYFPIFCLLLLFFFFFQGCICRKPWSPVVPLGNNQIPAINLRVQVAESRCAGHWAISMSGPTPTAGLLTALRFVTMNVSEVLLIKLAAWADGNSSVMWNKLS